MKIRTTGAALGATLALVAATPATGQEQARTISVSGAATTMVPNDTARFVFGVRTESRSPATALRRTSTRLRRVVSAVIAQGVAPADVVTSNVSVTRFTMPPRPGSTRRVRRYAALNSVRVTVRRVDAAGSVLDAAVLAGATSASGPNFAPGDVGAAYRVALVAAFQEAKEKAQRLATEAGVTLGAPVSIREGAAPAVAVPTPPQLSLPPGSRERARRRAAAPVRPGRTRIRAHVAVVFTIS